MLFKPRTETYLSINAPEMSHLFSVRNYASITLRINIHKKCIVYVKSLNACNQILSHILVNAAHSIKFGLSIKCLQHVHINVLNKVWVFRIQAPDASPIFVSMSEKLDYINNFPVVKLF